MIWSRIKVRGFHPSPRAGCCGVLCGTKWYISGGGSRKKRMYFTVFLINFTTKKWKRQKELLSYLDEQTWKLPYVDSVAISSRYLYVLCNMMSIIINCAFICIYTCIFNFSFTFYVYVSRTC